jgi:hypothetical protein
MEDEVVQRPESDLAGFAMYFLRHGEWYRELMEYVEGGSGQPEIGEGADKMAFTLKFYSRMSKRKQISGLVRVLCRLKK